MLKNKFFKYGSYVLLVLGFLGAVSGLNVAVQRSTDSSREGERQASSLATKLNVALVNEDNAVSVDGKVYHLGSSYAKTIERDSSHNWSIVSRGTAEKGLREGDYQLLVTIPNDFSSKILDINSVNVDKATITYKTNAAGNLQVENEANKLAKSIIADLNSQLVDMYMASILSNLYEAQQNVKSLSATHSTNVSAFRSNLYQPLFGFKETFPNLLSQSTTNLSANSALRESLSSTIKLYQDFSTAQTNYKTHWESLLSQRAQDKLTDEQFAAALFELDSSLLSQETEQLFQQLKVTQEALTRGLVSEGDTAAPTYSSLLDSLNTHIQNLESQLQAERSALATQKEAIRTFAEEQLVAYYGESLENQSLEVILSKSPSLKQAMEDYQQQLEQMLEASLTGLPARDPSQLAGEIDLLDPTVLADIDFDATLVASRFGAEGTQSEDLSELSSLAAALRQHQTKEATFSVPKTKVSAKLRLQVPEGLVLESWTLNGETYQTEEVTVDLEEQNKVAVKVSYAQTTATPPQPSSPQPVTSPDPAPVPPTDPTLAPDSTVTPAPETSPDSIVSTPVQPTPATPVASTRQEAQLGIQIDGVTVTAVDFDWEEYRKDQEAYRKAQAAYAAKVGELVGRYNQAGALLDAYYQTDAAGNRQSLTEQFLTTGAQDLLIDLLAESMTQSLTSYENSLLSDENLENKLTALKELQEPLSANLNQITANNAQLLEQISQQLSFIEQAQSRSKSASDLLKSQTEQKGSRDSELSALDSELTAMLTGATSVSATSEQNLEEMTNINNMFSTFNNEVQQIQADSDKLSQDTAQLLSEFESELARTGDFTSTFSSVLNNAYANGVPNEVLLAFLSNPLRESSSSIQATVNVYRPFTWILLLEMVSLFAAYLFATYKVAELAQDKFKLTNKLEADALRVALLTGLSVVSGLAIGTVSGRSLLVEPELFPSWVLVVTLFSLLLTQGHYFLLKHLKGVGMGISFFTIISFVYLSNAIGTTASLSGFPAVLKATNALSILENSLSQYFDGQTASLPMITLTLLAGIGFAVANVLFNPSKRLEGEGSHDTIA